MKKLNVIKYKLLYIMSAVVICVNTLFLRKLESKSIFLDSLPSFMAVLLVAAATKDVFSKISAFKIGLLSLVANASYEVTQYFIRGATFDPIDIAAIITASIIWILYDKLF